MGGVTKIKEIKGKYYYYYSCCYYYYNYYNYLYYYYYFYYYYYCTHTLNFLQDGPLLESLPAKATLSHSFILLYPFAYFPNNLFPHMFPTPSYFHPYGKLLAVSAFLSPLSFLSHYLALLLYQ